MAERNCGDCVHFHGAKPLPPGMPVPRSYVPAGGQCRRYPTPVSKQPEGYWCGEGLLPDVLGQEVNVSK